MFSAMPSLFSSSIKLPIQASSRARAPPWQATVGSRSIRRAEEGKHDRPVGNMT